MNKTIDINQISRVEGDSALRLEYDDNDQISKVLIDIWEPARFFEGFMVGRSFDEIGDIVARICGLCPVSHMMCAIQAIEEASGIVVSEQTQKLRRLLLLSQMISSHVVHLFVLAIPDYYEFDRIADLLDLPQDIASNMIRLKDTINELSAAIGGRAIHPVTPVIGGFTKAPDADRLRHIRDGLIEQKPFAWSTLDLILSLEYPVLDSRKEHVAILIPTVVGQAKPKIVSTNGLDLIAKDYRDHFVEFETDYAMAKKTVNKNNNSYFMTGALPRINNNHGSNDYLDKTIRSINFKVPDFNPFHNNIAQAIEIVSGIDECIDLLEDFEPVSERPIPRQGYGQGHAALEAPRGLLYHAYEVNSRGLIEKADIVSPTAHNFGSIEEDLSRLAIENADLDRDTLISYCEKLIRSYDPCFSCSVH